MGVNLKKVNINLEFVSERITATFQPSHLTARQRALGGEDGGILSQVQQINIGNLPTHGLMIATVFNLCFKLEFGSRAKEKAASELTEEEKNVKDIDSKLVVS